MSGSYTLENYSFLKTIGEGTFGKVKLSLHKLTQEQVAIKILEKNKIINQKDLERIEKEIKYMKMLNHPNIVKIYEIIEDENNYYISMEYVPGGELFNYIVKNKRLTENESSFFYSQIIHIIKEIHKHKICHRDLKPENLLLTQHKTIKITDFGLSNEYEDFLMTPCGSPCYASPEVLKGKKYSGLGIDLWASGIILYSMLCGYLPFDDKNNDELFKKILKCKIEFPKSNNIIISENAKDLIRKILQPEPSKRITLEEILEHPFLAYGNKKYKEKIRMDINKQDKLIIDYMTNTLGISNEKDIRKNINDNRHNNITTIFYLLKKKYNEGRFDYSKLVDNNDIKNKKLNKLNSNKINRRLKTGLDNENTINNIIKKKIIKNNNIIIINNNNLLNRPKKLNCFFDPLLGNNSDIKENYEKIIKKIDTSVSIEKPKRQDKSPEYIKINDDNNNTINNKKIREKRIFYKKYVNTSISNGDISLDKKNNSIYSHHKNGFGSLNLKTLTNFQNYTLNKIKNKTNFNQAKTKNSVLIDSFNVLKNHSNMNNKFYKKVRINSNLNNSILHKYFPEERISTRHVNIEKYIDETKKYEKTKTLENPSRGYRKSVNFRDKKNDRVELFNLDENNNSFDENNNNLPKEQFFKKINLNKLKLENRKTPVNKLSLNDSSIINNIGSYKDKFSKDVFLNFEKVNRTINNENIGKIESKRLNLKKMGITNKSTLIDSITYSKKICGKNKGFNRSNNYLILSTNLKLYYITKRISKFCNEHNLLFRQNGDKYLININNYNEFMVDIKDNEGSYIIKFTHEKGEEKQTKIYMNNLFTEIAK